MPDLFNEFVEYELQAEGGYVDDPDDPGGATNFGISLKFYRDEIDPKADKNAIKALTRDQAIAIYQERFWNLPGCGRMPPAIALLVFDGGINQGRNKAISLLQRSLRMPVEVIDGVYGSKTQLLASMSYSPVLIDELTAQRANAYGDGNFKKYGLGWMRRLIATHSYAIEVYNRPNL